MNFYQKHKKKLVFFLIIIFIILLVFFYLTQTTKGGSYALYIAGGWHAPISVKIRCAEETNLRVDNKFKLPLLIDEKSKDKLKGFWYYSYYKECLHNAGYDFSGNKILNSIIEFVNGEFIYKNIISGIYFVMPKGAEIVRDNILNVDFDDRLLISTLKVNKDSNIFIHTYINNKDLKNFNDVDAKLSHISTTNGKIIDKIYRRNSYSVDFIELRQDDGMYGFIFFTPDGYFINIFGDQSIEKIMNDIMQTVQFIKK